MTKLFGHLQLHQHLFPADIGSKEVERINNISSSDIWSSIRDMPSSEPANQGEEGSILHGNFLIYIYIYIYIY